MKHKLALTAATVALSVGSLAGMAAPAATAAPAGPAAEGNSMPAHAGTAVSAGDTGHGKKHRGCRNYVKVWRSGSKVYASAKQTCNKRALALRPMLALSANGGKDGFVQGGKACKFAKKCKTKKVSLKAKKGWVYRANNPGSATTGRPGDDDGMWPRNTVAHATYKAK